MGRLTKSPGMVPNASAAASGFLPGGVDAERPTDPGTGDMRYNTATPGIEYWDGSVWQTFGKTGLTTIVVDIIAGANGALVAFTMAQSVANEEDILVFVGGVFQVANTNYGVSATTITFTSPPPNLETITVLHNFNEIT